MGKSCTFKCPLPAPSEIGYKKRDPITMIVAMDWAQPCWNVIIVTVVVRSGMDYQSKLCSNRSFKESSSTRTNHIIHFDPPCICIPPLSKQKEGYKTQYAHIYIAIISLKRKAFTAIATEFQSYKAPFNCQLAMLNKPIQTNLKRKTIGKIQVWNIENHIWFIREVSL